MKLSKAKVQLAMIKAEIATQGALALKAGVAPNTVVHLLRGAQPKLATLQKLAAALNVEPEQILQEE